MPVSPVANARKFSAVLGTTSEYNSKTIFPSGFPAIAMSKNTFVLAIDRDLVVSRVDTWMGESLRDSV